MQCTKLVKAGFQLPFATLPWLLWLSAVILEWGNKVELFLERKGKSQQKQRKAKRRVERRQVINWIDSLLCNISNMRDSVSSGYPNTKKRVENTTRSGVFLMKFEVFGWPMKHCLECLIYLLNRNTNYGVNGEVKSSKSMLIKTGYQNLLHGCDFLCSNLMNY